MKDLTLPSHFFIAISQLFNLQCIIDWNSVFTMIFGNEKKKKKTSISISPLSMTQKTNAPKKKH